MQRRELEIAYPKGEIVRCRVVRRKPFGVFVEIDGTSGVKGFIHSHDWSWSRRILDLRELVKDGDLLDARVLEHHSNELRLSRRRALPNPYEEFRREYKAGETVIGEVQFVTKRDAGVLLAIDGVDGFVPRVELPKSAQEMDGFGLFAGDRLAARILRFDEKEVRLSVRRATLLEKRPEYARTGAPLRSHGRVSSTLEGFYWDLQLREIDELKITDLVRQHINRVLVVEDNSSVSASLEMVFEHLGLACDSVDSVEHAGSLLSLQDYDLVLLDINLSRGRGVELLESMRGDEPLVYVLSAASADDWKEILGQHMSRVAAFFRKPAPVREIFAQLHQHYHGSDEPMSHKSPPPKARPVATLATEVPLLDRDRQVKMEEVLAHLIRDSRADQAFVLGYRTPLFHLVAGRFSVLTRQVQQSLEMSPVGTLIREHAFRVEPDVESSPEVYRHLTDVLPVGSFAGVGLDYRDQAEYGLFLLGRKRNQLSGVSEVRLRMAALQIGSLLAEERFDQVITEKQSLLLTGFLADSLLHEIKNEIQALDDFSAIPVALIKQHGEHLGRLNPEEVNRLKQSAVEIQGVARSLADLVRLFRHIASRPHEEVVGLNETVLRLVKTLRPFAGDHDVEVESDLGQKIPELELHPKLLEQPLLNLMINAIEQMSLSGASERRLTITTRFSPEEEYPVRITVEDTGPGISRVYWDKVFELFFTTKPQGTGLGLYISRFFIRRLGGRLRLAESLRFSGSRFEIELPKEVVA